MDPDPINLNLDPDPVNLKTDPDQMIYSLHMLYIYLCVNCKDSYYSTDKDPIMDLDPINLILDPDPVNLNTDPDTMIYSLHMLCTDLCVNCMHSNYFTVSRKIRPWIRIRSF